MAEGQGLSKLLPANSTHSFSAHCSAQNPTKRNSFIAFCLNNTDQIAETIYFHELPVVVFWALYFFFFLFAVGLKICSETWKPVLVNRPQKQELWKAAIYLLFWPFSTVWKWANHFIFLCWSENCILPIPMKCLTLSAPAMTMKAEKQFNCNTWDHCLVSLDTGFFPVFLSFSVYLPPTLAFLISCSPCQKELLFIPHSGVLNLTSWINQPRACCHCT